MWSTGHDGITEMKETKCHERQEIAGGVQAFGMAERLKTAPRMEHHNAAQLSLVVASKELPMQ